MSTSLRYPIGQYQTPALRDAATIEQLIQSIEDLPANLLAALNGLNEAQLDTPYRPDGWTVRQVVHHMADSHMNAFIRFKLAITEDHPSIKPYFEDRWAELPDSLQAPIELSTNLLVALHLRWALLLRSLKEADFQKTYFHPEAEKTWELFDVLGLYAWHSQHHLAHITELIKRSNW